MKEFDAVVLTKDFPEHGLEAGDVGTVVFKYPDGGGIEAEFVTAEGRTLAVLKLDRSAVRPMEDSEILHVRSVAKL